MKVIGISPHRRNFLRKAAVAVPVAAALGHRTAGTVLATGDGQGKPYQPTYFTAAEWATLCALVDRLIPADAEGPGALQAGVHEFIDLQMDTPYAYGKLWFMQAPFVASPDEFGYQFHMAPRELYRSALPGFAQAVQQKTGKLYADLPAAQRDALISELEKGTLTIGAVPPSCSSSNCCKTRAKAISATRPMAATRTWPPGA